MKQLFSIMRATPEDRSILRLALPSIVSNITVPLLGLIDVAIVGHMGDARNIAAIAVGTMIFNVMYWILGFIRMSVSGMTAQSYGRRDLKGVAFFLVSTLLFSFLFSLLLILFQRPIFALMVWVIGPGANILPFVDIYYRICTCGAPAVLGLYSLSGWLNPGWHLT